MSSREPIGSMTTEGHTFYARAKGEDWHIVRDWRRPASQYTMALAICGKVFRIHKSADAIRKAGDAPACPACLRWFYRQDDKRP